MPNIRWRTKDVEQLQKEVERYNRKIKRLEKKGITSDIFEGVKLKDLKTDITTRSQYNDTLARLRNLTKRGSEKQYAPAAEKGISLTEGERAELNRQIKIINRDRRKMKKEYEMRSQSKIKDLPKNDINRIQMSPKPDVDTQLSRLKYEKGLNKLNFKEFKESIKKQADTEYLNQRYEQYKENYTATIPKTIGYLYGSDIITRLQDVDPKEFYYASIMNEEFTIDFLYDPLTQAEKAEAILNKMDYLGW